MGPHPFVCAIFRPNLSPPSTTPSSISIPTCALADQHHRCPSIPRRSLFPLHRWVFSSHVLSLHFDLFIRSSQPFFPSFCYVLYFSTSGSSNFLALNPSWFFGSAEFSDFVAPYNGYFPSKFGPFRSFCIFPLSSHQFFSGIWLDPPFSLFGLLNVCLFFLFPSKEVFCCQIATVAPLLSP